MGKKDQWHFGFECAAKKAIHTVWIETLEESGEDLSGVTHTAFTSAPTSHVFASTVKEESEAGKE